MFQGKKHFFYSLTFLTVLWPIPIFSNKYPTFYKLVQNMKYYKTINIDFHAGHLYAHSMWTAQVIDEWFEQNNEWIQEIKDYWYEDTKGFKKLKITKYRNLLVLAAFLHDIGKASNKLFKYSINSRDYFHTSKPKLVDYPYYSAIGNHPRVGFEMIMPESDGNPDSPEDFFHDTPLTTLANNEKTITKEKLMSGERIDIEQAFLELGLTTNQRKFIGILIGIHWDFGGDIMRPFTDKGDNTKNFEIFLKKLGQLTFEANYQNGIVDKNLLICSILIGAADVRGSSIITNYNEFINRYPWFNDNKNLFEEPQEHGEFSCIPKFEEFNFPTKGLSARQALISYFEKTYPQGYNFSKINPQNAQQIKNKIENNRKVYEAAKNSLSEENPQSQEDFVRKISSSKQSDALNLNKAQNQNMSTLLQALQKKLKDLATKLNLLKSSLAALKNNFSSSKN